MCCCTQSRANKSSLLISWGRNSPSDKSPPCVLKTSRGLKNGPFSPLKRGSVGSEGLRSYRSESPVNINDRMTSVFNILVFSQQKPQVQFKDLQSIEDHRVLQGFIRSYIEIKQQSAIKDWPLKLILISSLILKLLGASCDSVKKLEGKCQSESH